MNLDTAKQIISLMDLTSLNQDDTKDKILALCQQAVTPYGSVAAVCVYPEFVETTSSNLAKTGVKIATVANFPYGNDELTEVVKSIQSSINNGADEIDLVIPYHTFASGDFAGTQELVSACRQICQDVSLKVILETGALQKPELIARASEISLEAGADFLKTSTGKIAVGATLEAAEVILREIKQYYQRSGKLAGFKASGGVKTLEQALAYIELATKIMGEDYITAEHFRFGASSLLNSVLMAIK